MTNQNYIRMPVLQKKIPLAKSTIYQKIASGTFPKPVKLGARAVAWLESDIDNWLMEQNQKAVA